MDAQITQIFIDGGASPGELELIEKACLVVAEEVRKLVVECSDIVPNPSLVLPLRVLMCRVIHADMEKAFKQYRTEG